jgi:hypothetical protein
MRNMFKYLFIIIAITSCTNNTSSNDTLQAKKLINNNENSLSFFETLITADSVILASFISPNEPFRDKKTGKFKRIEFKIGERLNDLSVQERKILSTKDINDLISFLKEPAVNDDVPSLCFQPRNGVFAFKNSKLYYLIVCFDCHGYGYSENFNDSPVFDDKKYDRFLNYFTKEGFKYMLYD